MNLGPLQPRTLQPNVGGVDAAALRLQSGGAALDAISGNSLMALDVWAGVSAAGRSFGTAGLPAQGDIEQTVSHILAPLG